MRRSLLLIFIAMSHVAHAAEPSAGAPATPDAYRPPLPMRDGWQVADARRGGWRVERLQALEAAIAKGDYPGVTSIVVAHQGKLVYERYFNGGGPDVLNDTRSATKSVTALLLGAAIDQGHIQGAQAPVYAYFADRQPWQNPSPRKQRMTLEDLLTMSSAWECDDENSVSAGNEERMYVSEDWTRFALDLPMRGFAPWMTRPEDSPHGRAFSYCTAGSFLLGAVIERATGKPLATFAAEALERPLGIQQVQWNKSSEGVGMGGGGTRYRSRDLAKLGQLVVDGGRWQGRQVISMPWINAALTVHAQAREDADYGYQFWRFRFPRAEGQQAAWAMSGNGGNYVFIVPERQLVAVITRTSFNQRNAHPQSQQMFGDYMLKAMP
ncbi:MAG: serine hydrolase [Pseudoxanthomonas mexicana]|nr:serine hydrolase [Pseudoxanthomonas mexicana]